VSPALVTDISGQPIGPETPVTTNQPYVKTPEEPRPHLHRGDSLKSKAKFLAFAFSYSVKARTEVNVTENIN
jgi:hypothetical protein